MGVLDDAIRDHLDLKRRHGASAAEIAKAEAEALGPARRDVPAEEEGGDGFQDRVSGGDFDDGQDPAEERTVMLDAPPAPGTAGTPLDAPPVPGTAGTPLDAPPVPDLGEDDKGPSDEAHVPFDHGAEVEEPHDLV